jgi:pimeloyl-ACP methyl ester carboxylesterase
MRKLLALTVVLVIPVLLVVALTHTVAASVGPPAGELGLTESDASSDNCEDGEQESGAKYRICMPEGWEEGDDLVVYAHGYVAPNMPVEIPEDQMVLQYDGESIRVDEIVTGLLGDAFATTSYYTNGLAVLPAISDLLDLVNIFTTTKGVPNRIYLAGVSEGGLITALSIEQHPEVYDGGLAMCGPYGDFQGQIDHFGDFRVVFDYFFPDLMPGSPISIPEDFLQTWQSGYYSTTVRPVIADPTSAISVNQLLNVTQISPYGHNPPTSTNSIGEVLGYNAFATNDGIAKLGGQPFDNHQRVYVGSNDDVSLNQGVDRFSAEQAALDEMAAHYQTTGQLSVPLVTLHTTGDPVVPYWHATRYRMKTIVADNIALHEHIRVDRYGHCSFAPLDVFAAFDTLVNMAENPPPYQPATQVFLPLNARAR